jgi:hypothetical protein
LTTELPTDSQTLAFTEAEPRELLTDQQLSVLLSCGDLCDTTDQPVVDVSFYEQDWWDRDRSWPKSLVEAKAALAARVADPSAPDQDATAYDGLEMD